MALLAADRPLRTFPGRVAPGLAVVQMRSDTIIESLVTPCLGSIQRCSRQIVDHPGDLVGVAMDQTQRSSPGPSPPPDSGLQEWPTGVNLVIGIEQLHVAAVRVDGLEQALAEADGTGPTVLNRGGWRSQLRHPLVVVGCGLDSGVRPRPRWANASSGATRTPWT